MDKAQLVENYVDDARRAARAKLLDLTGRLEHSQSVESDYLLRSCGSSA